MTTFEVALYGYLFLFVIGMLFVAAWGIVNSLK